LILRVEVNFLVPVAEKQPKPMTPKSCPGGIWISFNTRLIFMLVFPGLSVLMAVVLNG
jgi:hypothetical protein